LARLFWLALHPDAGISGLPVGWFQGKVGNPALIRCGAMIQPAIYRLEQLLSGQSESFGDWIRNQMTDNLRPFAQAALEADLEYVDDAFK
jgi:hypothetical protein